MHVCVSSCLSVSRYNIMLNIENILFKNNIYPLIRWWGKIFWLEFFFLVIFSLLLLLYENSVASVMVTYTHTDTHTHTHTYKLILLFCLLGIASKNMRNIYWFLVFCCRRFLFFVFYFSLYMYLHTSTDNHTHIFILQICFSMCVIDV